MMETSIGYTQEKFFQAVDTLATSDAPLTARLKSAYQYLLRTNPASHLDDHARRKWEVLEIKCRGNRFDDMDEVELHDCAREIVSLYQRISETYYTGVARGAPP